MDQTGIESFKGTKGENTRRRILESAAELIARKGYDGVSMREIAALAGLRESSLYNHFQGKQQILSSLFEVFSAEAPRTRPSAQELDRMLLIMEPEEIFKSILFQVGGAMSEILMNTAMIIDREKFGNASAAEVYLKSMILEPIAYYESLIGKMADRGMVKAHDAPMIASQYNYTSITLTQQYFMARHGMGDERAVVRTMVETVKFYCGLMKV